MNLLYLNHNVKGRSTYFRCLHFARALARRGHEVTLLTISPQARLRFASNDHEGVRVIETPDLLWGMLRSGWDPWDTVARIAYLGNSGFDVVHAFDCRPAVVFPALYSARIRGARLVMDWADWWGRGGAITLRHGVPLNRYFAPIETFFEERFRRFADGWTVISHALYERSLGLGLPRARIQRIPSGADVRGIRPLDKLSCRRQAGLPVEGSIVAFVGFVHYDIDLVVRAFRFIHERYADSHLLLVGPRSSPASTLAAELGIGDRVIQTGAQPYERLPVLLGAADVLLLPLTSTVANMARWPNKIGDYMAAGRPIVTNAVGEMRYVFEEHAIGQLAPEDPGGFATSVIDVLSDPVLADEMGRNARSAAEEVFSWDVLAPTLERFYQQVLGGWQDNGSVGDGQRRADRLGGGEVLRSDRC